MSRKLLIRKEKRTYTQNKDNTIFYESNLALQMVTNEGVQIRTLENINLKSLLPYKTYEEFFHELDENRNIIEAIKLIYEKYKLTNYEVTISMEDVLIKKFFFDAESIINIQYGIVTYTISKDSHVICSNYLILEWDYKDIFQKVCEKIDQELLWYEREKLKCDKIPLIWIFSQEVAGYFFHECIGHILEEDIFRISNYKMGDMFFKNNITIYENWKKECDYDDVGNEVKEKICLINSGKIENYLSGYDVVDGGSGNVFTEEVHLEPKVRMSSMFIEGTAKELKMTEEVVDGIYIEEVSGGECEPITGEIGLCVNKAYHITNGKKDYFYEPFSIIFNLQDLKEVEIKIGCRQKTTQSLCFKYGAIKKIEYTTPDILIDWRKNSECITNRIF